MKAPAKYSLLHVVFIPPVAMLLDLVVWFGDGPFWGLVSLFLLAVPFFFLTLAIPASIHGLLYWWVAKEKKINRILSFIVTVSISSLLYFVWFFVNGDRVKKEIDQSMIVMALSAIIVFVIFEITIRETEPERQNNKGSSPIFASSIGKNLYC